MSPKRRLTLDFMGEDFLSQDKKKLRKLIKKITAKSRSSDSANLGSSIRRLEKEIQKLPESMKGSSEIHAAKQLTLRLRKRRKEVEHRVKFIKRLREELKKKLMEEAIEREREYYEKIIDRMEEEAARSLEQIKEAAEMAQLLVDDESQEFYRRVHVHSYRLLDEIEEEKKRYKLEEDNFNLLSDKILNSSLLEGMANEPPHASLVELKKRMMSIGLILN